MKLRIPLEYGTWLDGVCDEWHKIIENLARTSSGS